MARFQAAQCQMQSGATGAAVEVQACLVAARGLGIRQAEGAMLSTLGNAYYSLGRYVEAVKHHTQALEIAREIGDRQGEGNLLGNLGCAYESLGQYAEAVEHHTQALEIAREIGDRQGEGNHLRNLGGANRQILVCSFVQ